MNNATEEIQCYLFLNLIFGVHRKIVDNYIYYFLSLVYNMYFRQVNNNQVGIYLTVSTQVAPNFFEKNETHWIFFQGEVYYACFLGIILFIHYTFYIGTDSFLNWMSHFPAFCDFT